MACQKGPSSALQSPAGPPSACSATSASRTMAALFRSPSISPDGGVVDASAWDGIELDVFGNGEEYGVHLRTDALTRPWQSYRQSFMADAEWRTVLLPFDQFVPHRTVVLLDTRRLRRIGVVAIGRPFSCDLALGGLRFMTSPRSVKEPSS